MGEARDRVPPGQGVTKGWPVLHFGSPPTDAVEAWSLRVFGCVARELHLGWDELQARERVAVTADFHCVTGWSHLDARWEGIGLADLLADAGVGDGAAYVRFGDGRDYDTSVPLTAALSHDVLLADREGGEPLPRERGGPLRVVVPSLYGWKSCKWVREVEVLRADRLGFWEKRGYANGADPWREERLI